MKNITSILPGLFIILLVLGCGFLGNLGIVVKIDELNTTMSPKTAVADVQNGSFAIANYELSINESEITKTNNLRKPAEEDQILITFKVNGIFGGSDVEQGKFRAKNISWFHVYYYKNGNLHEKALNDFEGFVLLPKFAANDTDILGALDITDGSTSLKGGFTATKIGK